MNVLAPAKINLYLLVKGRLPSGFHVLQTVFQTIDLFDELHWQPTTTGTFTLIVEGPDLGPIEDNLVFRAADLFARALRLELRKDLPGTLKLKKNIPHGGGLGGGSSDAASTLNLLNQWKGMPLKKTELLALASQLGSDVPFFTIGGTCLGRGRGEILEPLELPEELPQKGFLFFPKITCHTPRVFGEYAQSRSQVWNSKPEPSLFHPWGKNHLEEPALNLYPEMKLLSDRLAHQIKEGFVFMSGSGSTWVWLTNRCDLPDSLNLKNVSVQPFSFFR